MNQHTNEDRRRFDTCEDCDGRGSAGDQAHYMGEFQPPEPERCDSCGGSGKQPVCGLVERLRNGGQADLADMAEGVVEELRKAHRLLQLALKHMGGERQSLFAAESEREGLGVDGATRHHERAAVIAKATGGTS